MRIARSSTTSDETSWDSWLIYSGDLSCRSPREMNRARTYRSADSRRDDRVVRRGCANSRWEPERKWTLEQDQSARPLYLKMSYLKMRRDETRESWWDSPDRRLGSCVRYGTDRYWLRTGHLWPMAISYCDTLSYGFVAISRRWRDEARSDGVWPWRDKLN